MGFGPKLAMDSLCQKTGLNVLPANTLSLKNGHGETIDNLLLGLALSRPSTDLPSLVRRFFYQPAFAGCVTTDRVG